MSEKLSIQSKWSNEMSQSEIKDWRYVVNTVFGPFCTEEYFKRKYLDNIYGPSLLTVAYVDKRPVKLQGCGLFTHPWHFDIFKAPVPGENESLFAVIQTDDKHADIRLARSDDGEHFKLYKKPLISSGSIGMKGIYKPTALVVGGTFILYYTARDNSDRSLNRLFVTGEDWATLLHTLQS